MKRTAEYYIEKLELIQHPEGGWYKETYRSEGKIGKDSLRQDFPGSRSYSTSILFLLQGDEVSALHKIKSDELWNFHDGNGLTIHELNSEGKYIQHKLGLNMDAKELPQIIIPAGSWFASEVIDDGDFCLVGCSVAPGFDFEDFQLAKANELLSKYPDQKTLVHRMCIV